MKPAIGWVRTFQGAVSKARLASADRKGPKVTKASRVQPVRKARKVIKVFKALRVPKATKDRQVLRAVLRKGFKGKVT
jgi:hypothetical protein